MPLDFLKPQFESELTASIDESGQVVIAGIPFTAVAILSKDEDAYTTAFGDWHEIWVRDQLDHLDGMLEVGANRKRYEDLCRLAQQGRLVPFVGSGLSAPSGLPTWSAFLRKVREHSTLTADELDALLAAGQHEEAAEALAAKMPARLFDEQIMHELRLRPGAGIEGAVRLLPLAFREVVITTNLDEVLEQTYESHGEMFQSVLVGPAIGGYRSAVSELPLLLKIHGTYRTSTDRVLVPAEYEATYAAGTQVREELSLICRTQALLCLGCSLSGDRTVELLKELAEVDKGMPPNFALLRRPDAEEAMLAREHFLVDRNIFPIWYDGDSDESVQALLVGLLTSAAVLP